MFLTPIYFYFGLKIYKIVIFHILVTYLLRVMETCKRAPVLPKARVWHFHLSNEKDCEVEKRPLLSFTCKPGWPLELVNILILLLQIFRHQRFLELKGAGNWDKLMKTPRHDIIFSGKKSGHRGMENALGRGWAKEERYCASLVMRRLLGWSEVVGGTFDSGRFRVNRLWPQPESRERNTTGLCGPHLDGGWAVGEHMEQQSDRPCGGRHNLRGRASGGGAEGIRNWVVRKTKKSGVYFNVIHLISPNVMTYKNKAFEKATGN